ncbi:MAG: hypothetical protein INF48_02190 [Rhodobacter sp.]|nr:hypothetical protein [Rhodobacter sp.]
MRLTFSFTRRPDGCRPGRGGRVDAGRPGPVIGIAAGPSKVAPIRAALKSRILNGLVTDEGSARAILAGM